MFERLERAFDVEGFRKWGESIRHVASFAAVIYILLVLGGRSYLKDRPGFQLRRPMFVWSLCLAVFSIAGTIRTAPDLFEVLAKYGWTYSICDSSFYRGEQTALWAYLFIASKIIELGDTAFIVLRKQRLTFLHCYHHAATLLYSFYSYHYHISSGRWFTVMNFSIHSLMYSYFALKSIKIRIPQFISMFITTLQILQMAVATAICVNITQIKLSGGNCEQSLGNVAIALLMYLSYFVLFVHFFYQSYAVPSSAAKRSTNGVIHAESKEKKVI